MKRILLVSILAFLAMNGLYSQEEKAQTEPLPQERGKVKLELVEEKNIDLDTQMEIAQLQGKSIVVGEKKKVSFFSKERKILNEIVIPDVAYSWCGVFSSENRKYIGIRYLPRGCIPSEEDRFMFFDETGKKLWELYRKEDRGILNLPPEVTYMPKIHISNDGARIVAHKGSRTLLYDKTTKLYFYNGENGDLIKIIELPHPYTWSSGWTPNSEMFVVTTPGDSPGGISRNDVVYAFDKNGNELWKYIAEKNHFISENRGPNHVFTDRFVYQSTLAGIIKVDKKGIGKEFSPTSKPIAMKKTGGFYLNSSNTQNFISAWSWTYFCLIEAESDSVLWEWQWDETQGLPEIVKCAFSKNDSLIAAFAFGGGKRWVFLFDVKNGFLARTELPTFTRETTVDIIFANDNEIIVVADRPKKFYKVAIKKVED